MENGRSGARPPRDDVRERLVRLAALAPLPRRSQELVLLLADPDLDILQLITLIEQTPALAARIMGVAESALFGHRQPPRHVADAVMRVLGLDLVRDLSLSLILSRQFNAETCRRFDGLRYWRHAMLTAKLAHDLAMAATDMDIAERQSAYLGGLLHSLGMLALADVAPELMDQVLQQAADAGAPPLSELQRRAMGLDYAAAGGAVASAWGLPQRLVACMAAHRDRAYDGYFRALVTVVRLADRIAACYLEKESVETCAETCATEWAWLGVCPATRGSLLARWYADADEVDALAKLFAGKVS